MLHTGTGLLTEKRRQRLDALFGAEEHVEVEATWAVYQRVVGAYRHPDRARGRAELQAVLDTLAEAVPAALREVGTLGRTLAMRARDILAYFDRPGPARPTARRPDGLGRAVRSVRSAK